MRQPSHPAAREIDLTRVLYALSDPTRLTIVRELAEADDQPCGSFPVSVSKSTLSQHFAVLRDAGVIRTRLEGTQRLQTLRRTELDKRFPGLLDAVLGASTAR